jgi:hypothetical protein
LRVFLPFGGSHPALERVYEYNPVSRRFFPHSIKWNGDWSSLNWFMVAASLYIFWLIFNIMVECRFYGQQNFDFTVDNGRKYFIQIVLKPLLPNIDIGIRKILGEAVQLLVFTVVLISSSK